MTGLLAFMERWKPGSTEGFEPATAEQIVALAKPHGGLHALPPVYREFLETMGASTGDLRLTFGTTSISALLADLAAPQRERPDSRHFLKFAIGEDDDNGRQPDEFFELTRPTPDGRDAAILSIREEDLVSRKSNAERLFPTFSDWLRSIVASRVVFETEPEKQTQYYSLGEQPGTPARAYEFFTRLGFSLTELGASADVVLLEQPERGAIALLSAPSTWIPRTGVQLRARDKTQQRLLEEIFSDHEKALSGG
ncbi:SMI1/KNR4 family protein [Myxococcus qinghaiensis]|uniref:SMI1/KNR4 family protein n=1 Tax=Myxococcus qinghaiensis TaxID=2906758 RepID=UPI0020A6F0FF|nr:SMI1/KNR4 family protein [Myxococcus qinghaiensis]